MKYNVHLAVTTGRADKVAQHKAPNFNNTGEQVKLLLEQMPNEGFYIRYYLHNYVVDQASPGKNPVMPLLQLKNNKIACIGTAIFKKDKMISDISTTETRTLVLLRGQQGRGIIPYVIRAGDEVTDRGAVRVSNKRKVRVTRQGDDYIFDIDIKLKGRLLERASHASLLDNPQQLKAIERAIEDEVRGDCYRLIDQMQNEWQVDSIDVSRFALAKWRREVEPQVEQGFIQKAKFRVKVKVEILRFGETT